MVRKDMIPIVEVFESFQGEGRFAGHRALFIRFAGCNLVGKCKYCDTDFRVRQLMTEEDLVDRIFEFVTDGGRLIVFTGGEPSLYSDVIYDIIDKTRKKLIEEGRPLELAEIAFQVETNGIIKMKEDPHLSITVSPKKGFHEKAIENYKNAIVDFKFVVGDVPADSTFWTFDEIKELVTELIKEGVDKDSIWLMPYGADIIELSKNARKVWELAKKLGVNYSDRLHIRIYGESLSGV